MKLLIVESPSKIKKISSYLGKDWQVEASFGHVRDLPSHEMGVTAPDYVPDYAVVERSKGQVAKLKTAAKQAEEIWLATDPDREGEAIAWHLLELLGKGKIVKRITFNEITESAIQKAVKNPRQIDMNLVMAQQGRRVLDRLYGYKISPALSAKLAKTGVSAGRVQSVALKLIVERERAIRDFKTTKHYSVILDFENNEKIWSAKWKADAFIDEDSPYITDIQEVQKVIEAAKQGVIVLRMKEQEKKRRPSAPLITSTLQQAAANKLKMSVGDTMKAAQKLFEAGFITYMRTDNPNLSDEAIASLHEFLHSVGQSEHIADKPNKWKAKEDAQEAHEAIRPTNFALKAAEIDDEQAQALYKLIRRAAIASQMKDAIYKVRTIELQTLSEVELKNVPQPQSSKMTFTASGNKLLYSGWRLMGDDYSNEDEEEETIELPELQENIKLQPVHAKITDLETKPPRRYSETSLVKALERDGIGRPATYANIIDTQLKRNYAILKNRVFEPTTLGEAVVLALEGKFQIMETAYTAEMETQLDAVAQGRANYVDVVSHYDTALNAELATFHATNIAVHGGTQHLCPRCNTGTLRRIKGKNGYFWGCSNYKATPACDYVANDDKGEPAKVQEISTEYPCPEENCSGFLQRHQSNKNKKKYWWGCSEYKNGCRYMAFDEGGKPKK